MKDKPDLNGNYDLKRPWQHPKDRDLPMENYDDTIGNIRKNNPLNDGYGECTFDPKTNPTLPKHQGRDFEDLLNWGEEKRYRQANNRLNELYKDNYNFIPDIDDKSNRIAGQRDGAVEDRLIQNGLDYTKKLKKQMKQEKDLMFNPAISFKSRELAAGFRPDELVKKDNGKTENVDFWDATPDGRGDGTFYCKSLKQKRDRLRASQIAAEMLEEKNRLAQAELDKKKAFDPNPLYTSPYCKELLNTSIPLKTIISRSKKVNTKNLTKYKNTLAQSKSKSKSRSPSKVKSMRGTVVSGFDLSPGRNRGQRSPSKKSPSKNSKDAERKARSASKSRSISKSMGIGKSRRKQLKEQNEKTFREQMMKEIEDEQKKSKSKKRDEGIKNLLPASLRPLSKAFVPKDPTSPTMHRKNYCSKDKKCGHTHEQDLLPIKKSAKDAKWTNHFTKELRDANVHNNHSKSRSKSNKKNRIRSDNTQKHERSQSRKIKSIFYKDGTSHTDIQSSKFSPTFTHVDAKSAKPFTLDGKNLILAGRGDHFDVYDAGNQNMYQSFKENSPQKASISKHFKSINLQDTFKTPSVRLR